MELFKGINYLAERTIRDKFRRELGATIKSDPLAMMQQLEQDAAKFVYGVRAIQKREDLEVVAVFFYPNADRATTRTCLVPKRLMDELPGEIRFWAVMKYYGLMSRKKFRGYIPIAQLVQQHRDDDAKDEDGASTALRVVPKGTQVGPLKGDVCWEDMVQIDNRWLKPRIPRQVYRGNKAWRPHPLRRGDTRTNLSLALDETKSSRRFRLNELANELTKKGGDDDNDDDDGGGGGGRRRPFSKEFHAGERIDVWNDGQWYAATVLDTKPGDPAPLVFVSYDGYDASFDEWVPTRGPKSRLAPLHMFSRRPKKKKAVAAAVHHSVEKMNMRRASASGVAPPPVVENRTTKHTKEPIAPPTPTPAMPVVAIADAVPNDDDDDDDDASEASLSSSASESSYMSDDEEDVSSGEEDDLVRRDLANKLAKLRSTFGRSEDRRPQAAFALSAEERLQARVDELDAEVKRLQDALVAERRQKSTAAACCAVM